MIQKVLTSIQTWFEGPKPLVLLNVLAFSLPITVEVLIHQNWYALFATIPMGVLLLFVPYMTRTTLSNVTTSIVLTGLMVALTTMYDANALWFLIQPALFGAFAVGTQPSDK